MDKNPKIYGLAFECPYQNEQVGRLFAQRYRSFNIQGKSCVDKSTGATKIRGNFNCS